MPDIWLPNQRQIDAHALPNDTFISPKITKKRIEMVRSNTSYREALEKAQRMAGYTDPALSIARGRTSEKDARSLFEQNEQAEQILKEKKNESSDSDIIA